MNFKKIAVLTSKKSWFVPYTQELVNILNNKGYETKLFFYHEEISEEFEIVFILSYFKIIPYEFLKKHKHNLVIHESDLPEGRGWAPLFWQILENKNKIPIVLFEATENVDEGEIYLKDYILLREDEIYDEIRKKQAIKSTELCLKFLENYETLKPVKQQNKIPNLL